MLARAELGDKGNVSSVYFHTLFLFTIAKNRQYTVHRNNDKIELGDFLCFA